MCAWPEDEEFLGGALLEVRPGALQANCREVCVCLSRCAHEGQNLSGVAAD